jgi:hypothetical protein
VDYSSAVNDDHAARLFVETIVLGPGAWEGELTPEMREVFSANAPDGRPAGRAKRGAGENPPSRGSTVDPPLLAMPDPLCGRDRPVN